MTLLEYCKAILGWGDFIHLEEDEEGKKLIYVCIDEIIKRMEKPFKHLDYKQQLEFEYFNAIMSNFLPADYENEIVRYYVENTEKYYLSSQAVKSLTEIQIVMNDSTKEYYATARRPYYRSRGKAITPVQAAQIMSDKSEIIHFRYITNKKRNINSNTDTSNKFPNGYELLSDAVKMNLIIPDLDCIIALTDWDEIPDYAWEIWPDGNWEEEHFGEYPGFLEHIELGIWIHNNTIEFMEPSRTRTVYEEYNHKYKEVKQ